MAALVLELAGCAVARRPPVPSPNQQVALIPVPPRPAPPPAPSLCPTRPPYQALGTASFYGKDLHGRTTASGEPFDMHAMTAAHRTLPFGTKIRVTNLKNGRSVLLTINDRGPFVEDRVLDVSRAAARELGFLDEEHLADVRIEAVRDC